MARSKTERHKARLTIVEAANNTEGSQQARWLIEALVELCVTIDEAAERIVSNMPAGE